MVKFILMKIQNIIFKILYLINIIYRLVFCLGINKYTIINFDLFIIIDLINFILIATKIPGKKDVLFKKIYFFISLFLLFTFGFYRDIFILSHINITTIFYIILYIFVYFELYKIVFLSKGPKK